MGQQRGKARGCGGSSVCLVQVPAALKQPAMSHRRLWSLRCQPPLPSCPKSLGCCSPELGEKLGPFSPCAAVSRAQRGQRGQPALLDSQHGAGWPDQRMHTHCAVAPGAASVFDCQGMRTARLALPSFLISHVLACVQGHVAMKPKRGDAIVFHSQKVGPTAGLLAGASGMATAARSPCGVSAAAGVAVAAEHQACLCCATLVPHYQHDSKVLVDSASLHTACSLPCSPTHQMRCPWALKMCSPMARCWGMQSLHTACSLPCPPTHQLCCPWPSRCAARQQGAGQTFPAHRLPCDQGHQVRR